MARPARPARAAALSALYSLEDERELVGWMPGPASATSIRHVAPRRRPARRSMPRGVNLIAFPTSCRGSTHPADRPAAAASAPTRRRRAGRRPPPRSPDFGGERRVRGRGGLRLRSRAENSRMSDTRVQVVSDARICATLFPRRGSGPSTSGRGYGEPRIALSGLLSSWLIARGGRALAVGGARARWSRGSALGHDEARDEVVERGGEQAHVVERAERERLAARWSGRWTSRPRGEREDPSRVASVDEPRDGAGDPQEQHRREMSAGRRGPRGLVDGSSTRRQPLVVVPRAPARDVREEASPRKPPARRLHEPPSMRPPVRPRERVPPPDEHELGAGARPRARAPSGRASRPTGLRRAVAATIWARRSARGLTFARRRRRRRGSPPRRAARRDDRERRDRRNGTRARRRPQVGAGRERHAIMLRRPRSPRRGNRPRRGCLSLLLFRARGSFRGAPGAPPGAFRGKGRTMALRPSPAARPSRARPRACGGRSDRHTAAPWCPRAAGAGRAAPWRCATETDDDDPTSTPEPSARCAGAGGTTSPAVR